MRSTSRPQTISLGGGLVVPYPQPTDTAATTIGKANKRKDTKAEVRLRSALHRRGLRFRKDTLVRCGAVKVRPDVIFSRLRVAVFVDGCFWHGCPQHGNTPRRNQSYWVPKLQRNVDRDRRVDAALHEAGWHVERIWEHELVDEAAARVEAVIRVRRTQAERT